MAPGKATPLEDKPMLTWQERQDLRPQLDRARAKLDEFDRRVRNRHVIRRVRSARPLHPFFVLRTVSLFAAAVLGVGALAVMVVSMVERDVAVFVSRIEAGAVLPVPVGLGLLALCGLLFALCAHLALLILGRSAPLLPREAREHQHLVSEVKRLEAQMAVHARLTDSPAIPRDIRP